MKSLFNAFKMGSFLGATLSVVVALLFSGCTKEVPEFEANNFDGITLTNSGIATKTLTLAGASNSALISGTCADTVEVVWIQDPNDTYWLKASDVALSGADLDCSDGTFSFAVDTSAGTFFYDRNIAFTKAIGIRGTTKLLAVTEYYFNFVYYGQAPPTLKFTSGNFNLLESAGSLSVIAQLSYPAAVNVTFNIGLSSVATYGTDYSISPNTLITIPAGQTSTNITFTAIEDVDIETNDTVTLSLSNITNAYPDASDQSVVGTILDNDVGPFSITGITAPTDAVLDSNLNGSAIPEFNWTTSVAAEGYLLEVFDLVANPVCASSILTPVLVYQFSAGCTLVIGTSYIARATAYRNNVAARSVNFAFKYNTPPVFSVASFYSLTNSGPFNLALTTFASDAEGGALLVDSLTTDTSGSATVTDQINDIGYTPSTTFYGQSTFTLVVRDEDGGSASQLITVRHVGPFSWSGNGGNNLWTTAANWCGSLNAAHTSCQGGTVPATGDNAYIDSTCLGNCTPLINSSVTVNAIKLRGQQLDRTGTLAMTIGGGGFHIENGAIFNGGTTGNITVNGPFNLSAGSFTSTSGTLSLRGDVTFAIGTNFIANNGTLELRGASGVTPEVINFAQPPNLNLFRIAKTILPASRLIGTATINNLFTVSSHLSASSTATLFAKAGVSFTFGGASRDLGSTTVVMNGTANQTLTVSDPNGAFNNLVIDKPSGQVNVNSNQDYVFINGSLDIMNLAAGMTYNLPTAFKIQPNTSNATITVNDAAFEFEALMIAAGNLGGGASTFLNSDVRTKFLRTDAGSPANQLHTLGAGKLIVSGDLENIGSDFSGTATIRLQSGAAMQSISSTGGGILPNVEIDNTLGVDLYGHLIPNNLTLSPNALVTGNGNVINVTNTLFLGAGSTFIRNGATVTYGALSGSGSLVP